MANAAIDNMRIVYFQGGKNVRRKYKKLTGKWARDIYNETRANGGTHEDAVYAARQHRTAKDKRAYRDATQNGVSAQTRTQTYKSARTPKTQTAPKKPTVRERLAEQRYNKWNKYSGAKSLDRIKFSRGDNYETARTITAWNKSDMSAWKGIHDSKAKLYGRNEYNRAAASNRQMSRDISSTGQTMESGMRKAMKDYYYRQSRRANGLIGG